MQRKAYVPGVAALLAALLAGCTGGSGGGTRTDDANPGNVGSATAAAQPGKYDTLPEPCSAVSHRTLESLLPGIQQITDPDQKTRAYEGTADLTYDTDRKSGCRWKVESTDATDHLYVDFERVVSYDNAVSDEAEAQDLFGTKQQAADLPSPTASGSASSSPTSAATPSAASSSSSSSSADPSSSSSATPADLQPRELSGLGDEAFLNDVMSGSASTAQQRTVTVAFRTSNVIVTIEYEEQPATVGVAPDSKEMQDRARKLASQLADTLGG